MDKSFSGTICKLRGIFKETIGVEIMDNSAPLFSPSFGICAEDMLYVLFEVESQFKITISDFLDTTNPFISIESLAETLNNKI